MKKKAKVTLSMTLVVLLLAGSTLVFSEPGSESDPLVTRSFVNNKIEELKKYVDDKLSSVNSQGSSSNELKVVELQKGQYLIGEAGTEIILRGGKANASGVKVDGGITDVTAGVDIDSNSSLLPYNHLLIIPRNDGRGAYAVDKAIFMVRGGYKIK